jgi:hypothetical protein
MLSHKEEAGFMAAEAFTAAEAFVAAEAFTVAEAFTAGVDSQVFMAGVVSGAFTGAILGVFTKGVSPGFTVITVFLAVIVFSVPASMGMGTGGVGVIPIIGVTHIILTIRTTRIIRTSRINRSYPATLFRQSSSSGRA